MTHYLRACRALNWRTAQLRANGIEPLKLNDSHPHEPPIGFDFGDDTLFAAVTAEDPDWMCAGLSDEVIAAGEAAWDRADDDLNNYVPGETKDWDRGMMVAAIFKAMGRKVLNYGR